MDAVFIASNLGKQLVERRWSLDGISSATFISHFFRSLSGSPPFVYAFGKYILVGVRASEATWIIGVLSHEQPVCLVIETLHVLADLITTVGDVTQRDVQQKIFEVIEEYIVEGYPVVSEKSIVLDIIKSYSDKRSNVVAALRSSVAEDRFQISESCPWRKMVGNKYTRNSLGFDIVEDLSVVIGEDGGLVHASLSGDVFVNARVSGLPRVNLQFRNPHVFKNAGFHPCVDIETCKRYQVISFVPPDGRFKLLSYRFPVTRLSELPILLKYHPMQEGFELTLSRQFKHLLFSGLQVTWQLEVAMVEIVNCTVGQAFFDQSRSRLMWQIPRWGSELHATPGLTCRLETDGAAFVRSPLLLQFEGLSLGISSVPWTRRIETNLGDATPNSALGTTTDLQLVSGLEIEKMALQGENYKVSRSARGVVRSWAYEVRV